MYEGLGWCDGRMMINQYPLSWQQYILPGLIGGTLVIVVMVERFVKGRGVPVGMIVF